MKDFLPEPLHPVFKFTKEHIGQTVFFYTENSDSWRHRLTGSITILPRPDTMDIVHTMHTMDTMLVGYSWKPLMSPGGGRYPQWRGENHPGGRGNTDMATQGWVVAIWQHRDGS